nr:hypothetical protein [Mycobacteroides abscessus]
MIKIAAAAAVAASIVFAPAAYADDDAYLDELSGQGFQVMWQSRQSRVTVAAAREHLAG